jgi:anti-anti-sigma regulatory factor
VTITLPAVVDFEASRHIHQAIAQAQTSPLCIDVHAVRHLGGLALQILLVSKMRWARMGLPFHVTNPSDSFVDALARLGLCYSCLEGGLQT